MKIFNFLSKIDLESSILSDHDFFFFFFFFLFLRNRISKLYFHFPSNLVYVNFRKNPRGVDLFSVDQLENNDRSGSKEGVVYCLLTYNL